MKTIAGELKEQSANLDAVIERDTAQIRALIEQIEMDTRQVGLLRSYLEQVRARKAQVEAQIAREEARLVKPQPADVKAAPDSPISV